MKDKFEWFMKEKPSKAFSYVGYIATFFVFVILLFFIYGQFFTSSHRLFGGDVEKLNEGWEIVGDGVETDDLTLPASIDCKDNSQVEISNNLPGLINDTKYLCVLNRWNLKIYVGNDERYSYEYDKDEITGHYVKSHFILIPVYPFDSGKTVRMTVDTKNLDSADFNEVYIGSRTGIFYHLMAMYGGQMVSAIALLVISLMVLITCLILIIIYRRRISLVLLSFGLVLTSLWFIFDSFLYQVLFSNYYVDGPMEYMLIMILPFFFACYLNYEQDRRYEKAYSFVCLFMMVNFAVMTFLHFDKIRPFESNIMFTSMNALVGSVIFIVSIIIDVIRGKAKDYILVVIGFSMIIVSGLIQIIVLNIRVDIHDARFLIAGMYLVLLFGLINMIKELRTVENISRRQKHANELKSSFLANMSHEIRTPLNAILGMNEMIFRESDDKEIRQYSNNIHNAGNTLLDIINDILDFSKIESGKMTLVETEYNLGNLLMNLYNMINIKAAEKDIKFIVDLDPDVPSILQGDENRIQQILINLLNNAIKYTEKGSVTFKIAMEERKTDVENQSENDIVNLKFSVTDTGIGIKDKDRDKLFATFERIDIKRNRSIEGTGLGLSITNNLIELMKGSLSVESVYGEGSTFIATIPQRVIKEEKVGDFNKIISRSNETNKVASKEYIGKDVKILVVDDVKLNIKVVKGLLKKHSIEIVEALSGPECIEKYEEGMYDLILLDHMMPDMDGIETLKLLREKYSSLCPVIVLTANAISGMKEMYLSEGFDDYLAKPTKPEELDKMILKYVSESKIEYK